MQTLCVQIVFQTIQHNKSTPSRIFTSLVDLPLHGHLLFWSCLLLKTVCTFSRAEPNTYPDRDYSVLQSTYYQPGSTL